VGLAARASGAEIQKKGVATSRQGRGDVVEVRQGSLSTAVATVRQGSGTVLRCVEINER